MYEYMKPSNFKKMKFINKLVFTTLIFGLFTLNSMSQEDPKARIGITGSGNVTWLKPDINGGYGYEREGLRLGYTGGIQLEIPLFNSPNYAFLTGVNILYHSGKLTYPDVVTITDSLSYYGTTTATYKLSYIEAPIMLKLKTNEIGYLTYYGQVGTSIGVKYRARMNWEQNYSQGTHTPVEQDIDISKETNLWRFPLIIGAGVEYNLSGNTSLVVGATFSNGFTNMFSWAKKNNPDVYQLEDDGKTIALDNATGKPIVADIRSKAITNYFGLQVGIIF